MSSEEEEERESGSSSPRKSDGVAPTAEKKQGAEKEAQNGHTTDRPEAAAPAKQKGVTDNADNRTSHNNNNKSNATHCATTSSHASSSNSKTAAPRWLWCWPWRQQRRVHPFPTNHSHRVPAVLLVLTLSTILVVCVLLGFLYRSHGKNNNAVTLAPADNNNQSSSWSLDDSSPPTASPTSSTPAPTPIPYWEPLGTKYDLHGQYASEYFGSAVALSHNGTILAVGGTQLNDVSAGRRNRGVVRVYRIQRNNQWQIVGDEILGLAEGEHWGANLALSADGTTVAASSIETESTNKAGLVRVYTLTSTSTTTDDDDGSITNQQQTQQQWTQVGDTLHGMAAGDEWGSCVALSANGRILAAGATKYDVVNKDDGTIMTDAGHVRLFRLVQQPQPQDDGPTQQQQPQQWVPMGQPLQGLAPQTLFGTSVALSSDGHILAAGSKFASRLMNDNGVMMDDAETNERVGHVRVFRYHEATDQWMSHGQVLYGEKTLDHFGVSVSLSADGNILAIGADWNSDDGRTYAGKVRVFEFIASSSSDDKNVDSDGQWRQLGPDIRGRRPYDEFGWRVQLSADGNTLAATAPYHSDSTGVSVGQVRVFRHFVLDGSSTSHWQQLGQEVDGVDGLSGERNHQNEDSLLGNSVALSGDASTFAAGQYWYNPGGKPHSGRVMAFRELPAAVERK